MQCVTIDHSSYVGRIGIGRVFRVVCNGAPSWW